MKQPLTNNQSNSTPQTQLKIPSKRTEQSQYFAGKRQPLNNDRRWSGVRTNAKLSFSRTNYFDFQPKDEVHPIANEDSDTYCQEMGLVNDEDDWPEDKIERVSKLHSNSGHIICSNLAYS